MHKILNCGNYNWLARTNFLSEKYLSPKSIIFQYIYTIYFIVYHVTHRLADDWILAYEMIDKNIVYRMK